MTAHREAGEFSLARLLLAVSLGALLAPATNANATIFATTADDICAPSAEECVIDDEVNVLVTTLDFGPRPVRMTNTGRLVQTSSYAMGIRCGGFTAEAGGILPGLVARQTSSYGTTGGDIDIEADLGCSDANVHCTVDADCTAGTCGVRRCSGQKSSLCDDDTDCDFGTCHDSYGGDYCTGNTSVRCRSNADCNSTCSPQTSCTARNFGSSGWQDGIVPCASNNDCDFGACTRGGGSIDLDTAISVAADSTGSVLLSAVGDVTVRRSIDATASEAGESGGDVTIRSDRGNVGVFGNVMQRGDYGGEFDVAAAGAVEIAGDIDVRGGESGGGVIECRSGGDLLIAGNLLASAMNTAGPGGEISLYAGNDLRFTAYERGATNEILINAADGPEWTEGGEAGSFYAHAARDIIVPVETRFTAHGGLPYGAGGYLELSANRDLFFSAAVDATSDSCAWCTGGELSLEAARNAEVASGATIDVSGGSIEGTGGDFTLAGGEQAFVDATVISRGGDFYYRGYSNVEISACSVRIGPNADLEVHTPGAENIVAGSDNLVIEAGARLFSESGTNILRYRDAAHPPVVDGTLTPVATLVAMPSLPTCKCANALPGDEQTCAAVCGDALLTMGEACDDGNAISGDGCDSNCTITACGNGIVAGTEQCDDGNTVSGDGCDSTCKLDRAASPSATCHTASGARTSKLRISDADGTTRDGIRWTLKGAQSTTRSAFGDPLAGTAYVLCVYGTEAETPGAALQAVVPSASECAEASCWRATGSGYSYRTRNAGSVTARLSAKAGGTGNIAVVTKGVAGFIPSLPLAQEPSVTAELRNSGGQCWSATFQGPATRNTPALFSDASD